MPPKAKKAKTESKSSLEDFLVEVTEAHKAMKLMKKQRAGTKSEIEQIEIQDLTLDLDINKYRMVTNVFLTAKCEEEKAAERLARIEHEKREQEFNQAAENEKQSLAGYDAARAQRVETERKIVEQASISKEKVQEQKEVTEYLRSLEEKFAKEDAEYKEMRKQQTRRVVEMSFRTSLRSEVLAAFSPFFSFEGSNLNGALGPTKEVPASDAHQVHSPCPGSVALQPLFIQFEFVTPASSWSLRCRCLHPLSGVHFGLQAPRCCAKYGPHVCLAAACSSSAWRTSSTSEVASYDDFSAALCSPPRVQGQCTRTLSPLSCAFDCGGTRGCGSARQ